VRSSCCSGVPNSHLGSRCRIQAGACQPISQESGLGRETGGPGDTREFPHVGIDAVNDAIPEPNLQRDLPESRIAFVAEDFRDDLARAFNQRPLLCASSEAAYHHHVEQLPRSPCPHRPKRFSTIGAQSNVFRWSRHDARNSAAAEHPYGRTQVW